MKSNPYVYPFEQFRDLSDKTIRWRFNQPLIWEDKDLKRFLSMLNFPLAKSGVGSVEEKIFSIFLDKNYLYGPASNILPDKEMWLGKIKHFTLKNKPLQFTIHGFPFKIPCPLKSNRNYPDLGEVLALIKLKSIVNSIKQVYSPGAKITIIGEGGFAKFVGVTENEWIKYRNTIKQMIKLLGFSKEIRVVDISLLEKNSEFKKIFTRIRSNLLKHYKQHDPKTIDKIEGTLPSVLRIISTEKIPEEVLMDIYNEKNKDPKIVKLRRQIEKKALDSVFNYHAYLMTRDELGFIQKLVPNSLPLTVSPKPNRLGVHPISPNCTRLPYHGVPVYYVKDNQALIEYLIDLKRSNKKYTPIFLTKDHENKPFVYLC